MNTQDYISSGILEQYALDMLSKAERRSVWLNIQAYPELAKELESIELSLEAVAKANEKAPSANFKATLFNELKSLDPVKADHSDQPIETKVIPIKESNKSSKFWAVAASLLLLVSAGYNFVQHEKIKESKQQVSELRQERSVLADQSQQFKTQYESAEEKAKKSEEQIKLFQNPEIQNILIKGSEISPESYAYVSYNKIDKTISLSGINLPEERENTSYQLWALVDGAPVDLGIFDSKNSLIKVSKAVENAGAFAVTLQDKGGNPTPNLEKLYLIGNV